MMQDTKNSPTSVALAFRVVVDSKGHVFNALMSLFFT